MSPVFNSFSSTVKSDRVPLPVGSSLGLYRGSFIYRAHPKIPVANASSCMRSTVFVVGRSRCHGQANGVKPLPLHVLARDAPQGFSIATSTIPSAPEAEIIVLGIAKDGLVTATPVDEPTSEVPGAGPDVSSIDGLQLALDTSRVQVTASENATLSADGALTESDCSTDLTSSSSVTPTFSTLGQKDKAAAAPANGNGALALDYVAAAASSVHVVAQTGGDAAKAAASAGPPSASSAAQPSPATASEAAAPHPAAAPGGPAQQEQQGLWQRAKAAFSAVQWGKLWVLTLLSISYIHQATTGFALPAMLPMISNELHLTDLQGALLTTGYSYLYAVALVPIGLLADRVSRPKLLAAGLALWSILTCTASSCRSFSELILARVGFAAAQGAQNPVCFSLIPELFPVNKSTALSLYNCAIYVGRALSFAAVLLARHLHDNDQARIAARGGLRVETRLDHLDRADLHSLSIMHTTGEMAAATPDKEFIFPLWEYGSELPDSAWRQVLRWIAVPGFLIGLAMMATIQEPRQAAIQAAAAPAPAPQAAAVVAAPPAKPAHAAAAAAAAPPLADAPAAAPAAAAAAAKSSASSSRSGVLALLRSPGFMSVTLAAALNDVGSYALIAWQSTFYERVYGLGSSAYAPVLATLLPIGGILGGVGGGYLADRMSRSGRRWWVTAGATCAAAPCLAASCLAPSPELSYAALVVGFALSEMWRAPSAVMARGIAPPSMGSTASALYLCVRNLLGGLGPLMVAGLIGPVGLQQAMLVVPIMYLASGVLFGKAELLYDAEMLAMAKAKTA